MTRIPSRSRSLLLVALAYGAGALVAVATARLAAGLHPILVALAADVAATTAVFAVSVVLSNSSVYDPYWSVAPVPIALYWWGSGGADAGLVALLALLLVHLWGIRLTWNWIRRWSDLTEEDWRYVDLRRRSGRMYWPLSFAGIHLFPTLLVFAGCIPLYPLLAGGPRPFRAVDLPGLLVTGLGIGIEAVADRQLWRYRRRKVPRTGALATGLWARCRHPNYLGEILFWWGLFLMGVAAEPSWWPSGLGAISITVLFLTVSIPWKDRRMLDRYPGDAVHRLPALIPRPR